MEAPIPNPRILVRVCVGAVAAGRISGLDQGLRNSSGSLAIFAAIRRASLCTTIKPSPAHLIGQISLLDAPYKPVDPFPKTPYGSFRSGRTLSIQNRNDAHALFVVTRSV